MTFEGLAPSGGATPPVTPYSEDGFVLTSVSSNNAIFSSSIGLNEAGFSTDYFAWDFTMAAPQITISEADDAVFDLKNLEIGESGTDGPIAGTDLTIAGFFDGGGSISMDYLNVTAATIVSPVGFENLISLTIMSANGDAGIDNIAFNVVPAPGVMALLGIGLITAGRRRRRE